MNFPAKEPENKQEDAIEAAERRRKEYLLDASTAKVASDLSWGERLLPVLYAAMETCWVYAILLGLASVHFFGTNDTLVPVWAPFVLILGAYWILLAMERRAAVEGGHSSHPEDDRHQALSLQQFSFGRKNSPGKRAADEVKEDEHGGERGLMPGTWSFITFAGVITLFLIWLHLYTQTAFVLDPSWLLAMLNDILLFNEHTFQIFSIVGLTVYFCWRGMGLARQTLNASHIFNTMRIGLGVIVAVVLVRAGQENSGAAFHNEVMMLLLIPIFLFLSLAAHSLARVTFIRHSHPFGLMGSISEQESSLLLVLAPIGLVLLLIAILVGSLVSPAFLAGIEPALAPFGIAFNWLAEIFSRVLIFLLTPIFWLFSVMFSHVNSRSPRLSQPLPTKVSPHPNPLPTEVVVTIANVSRIVVLILLVLLAYFVLRRVFRRRRVRMGAKRREQEVHESLWSWSLFWRQFRSLWLALFRRFRPKAISRVKEQDVMQKIEGEPAVRTIREIYRALLKKALLRGYPRKKYETPYEFEQRLHESVPLTEPLLEEITSSYAATRYGGVVPDEAEVARVRRVWNELEQKWV